MRVVRAVGLVAGPAIAIAGLLVGVLPASGTYGGECGSAFAPRDLYGSSVADFLVIGGCDDTLGARRAWAIALILLGLVVLAASLVGRARHAAEAAVPAGSLAAEVDRLVALHKAGTLSDEEFAAAKRRVVGAPSDD
ncbi:SHOCT domain-containing protein [Cellulomonas soli]|uniref:SHOCT domain-containing protein n=1 Tax=Cellulomonas soli TaxID=931535 RepID=UPI003F867EAA